MSLHLNYKFYVLHDVVLMVEVKSNGIAVVAAVEQVTVGDDVVVVAVETGGTDAAIASLAARVRCLEV